MNMEGVSYGLQSVAKRAIEITVIDFGIPNLGGLRTASEQHQLFLDGKSHADGYQKESYHQSGKALDFYAIDPETGKASWAIEHLALVACALFRAAMELGIDIEWGGFWGNGPYKKGFTDMPHIQEKK